MAKKTIISDFSALKGKVSFSERSSDAKMSRKVTPAEVSQKPKVSDDGLKVGQSVVLMDSDLRGTIVGLGKKVRIELEDGLIIESSYGEFAVTDKAEIASLKETNVKAKKTSSASKQAKAAVNSDGSLIVDLHIEAIPGGTSVPKGQQLQFQMDIFRKVIRENICHRGRKITFIHGIGDGILKAAIRKELDEVLALRCSYSVGDPAVTVVSIK
ncbi:MAG: Smr/MutS family protein [Bacteroidales bacterium]|nr:Smr/MutS family protein [Bacteroidales bacterium]